MSEYGTVFSGLAEYPGYLIGTDGTVLTCRLGGKIPPGKMADQWRVMKHTPLNGYPSVPVRTADGKEKRIKVAVLVLLAHDGPRPDGMECCHNDGRKGNSRLSNLRWDTHQSNISDRERHGTVPRGEWCGGAKLNAKQVREIREKDAAGESTQRSIASEYGVSEALVSNIVRRKVWTHI